MNYAKLLEVLKTFTAEQLDENVEVLIDSETPFKFTFISSGKKNLNIACTIIGEADKEIKQQHDVLAGAILDVLPTKNIAPDYAEGYNDCLELCHKIAKASIQAIKDDEEGEKTIRPQKAGELFEGEAWRVESGLFIRGSTAKEIIDFEANELGNIIIAAEAYTVAGKYCIDLSSIPENEIQWVTKTEEEANIYYEGGAERVDVPEGSRILAVDPDGGYLIWKGK
jgi:Lhr-like helicase